MCVSSWRIKLSLSFGVLALVASVSVAAPEAVDDAHQLPSSNAFQKTIEERCTVCHTRERVDAAISQEAELDALMRQMIERGAILNEGDKNILGTFWGSPLERDKKPVVEPTGR